MPLNLELHAKELLLHPILQNINEGILITNTSLNIIYLNENAGRILGIKPELYLGKHVDTIKPSLNLPNMVKSRQRISKEIEVINDDEVLVTRGLLEIKPDFFACYAILLKIDSFKDYELNSLLQTPYEAIAIFDSNAQLLYANDVCRGFFDCPSPSDLHRELSTFIPRSNLEEAMNNNKPLAGEVISANGQVIKLIYLPIVRRSRNIGVIVKSIPGSAPLPSRENHQGTAKYCLNHIVGTNKLIKHQKELAAKAARTVSTILITGESGTGKEVFAHAIHNMSPRRQGPFIKVNCAAVPETLLESELFGYNEGAFTGALKEGKPGKFEMADNGTIFLDEIADMSLSMQAKLLRVLQEKEVERIGSTHTTRVNVRVIAATNKDLSKLVLENSFREDLFYRLNVILLKLSPLRERADDIPLISNSLLQRLNQQLGTRVERFSKEVMEHFCSYDWPGNVRELENTIERAINFCESNTITLVDIPENIAKRKNVFPAGTNTTLGKLLEQHEKEVISSVLESCAGNKSKAAKTLDIHRSVLYRKMTKYNINA